MFRAPSRVLPLILRCRITLEQGSYLRCADPERVASVFCGEGSRPQKRLGAPVLKLEKFNPKILDFIGKVGIIYVNVIFHFR